MTNNFGSVEDSELVAGPGSNGQGSDEQGVEVAGEATTLAQRFEAAVEECKLVAECIDETLWPDLPERERVARLLTAVTGSTSKAERYRDCEKQAIPVVCSRCEAKYYTRYRCTLRFCERCGPWHFMRLMEKYREPIARLVKGQASQRGRTLAKLTFTLRARDEMPDQSEPRRLNKLVGQCFARIHDRCRCGHVKTFHVASPRAGRVCYQRCAEAGCSCARFSAAEAKPLWGCIFAVETGHEAARKHPGRAAGGWNLHVHALFYGPFINQAEAMNVWEALLGYRAGIRIEQCPGWKRNPDRAVQNALVHHFGYLMKPAADSPERIAALEALFRGTRRIHAKGRFYRLQSEPRNLGGPCCPRCREPLPINLRHWQKSERRAVEALEAEGYQDLRAVTRKLLRAQVLGARSP